MTETRPQVDMPQSKIQSELKQDYVHESKLPYVQARIEGNETDITVAQEFEEYEKRFSPNELESGNHKAVKSGYKKKSAPTIEKDLTLRVEDRKPQVYRIDFQLINKEKDRHRFGFHKLESNPQTLDSQSKLNLQGYREPNYLNPNAPKTNMELQVGFSGRKEAKQWLNTGEIFNKNVDRYTGYAVLKKRVANTKE